MGDGTAHSGERWTEGNTLRLLENGEEYFPRVFEAIQSARHEVLVETFIWFEDEVGRELRDALAAAADRGASVDVTVDGFGTPHLSAEFLAPLKEHGVRVFTFDPSPSWLGVRINPLCRLHRKIVVVDGETAFIGGINYSEDQLAHGRLGPDAKQDFAVEARGPIAAEVQRFCHRARQDAAVPARRRRYWLRRTPRSLKDAKPGMQALLVTRDNTEHPTDIETAYRAAFRRAKRRITVANAYFFPGHRFLRDLRRAAARGVQVRLILQGRPDEPGMQEATSTLYETLLRAGIEVLLYQERALHGKVAVVDDEWATVGSSNLDPLSLALNLEANLLVRDPAFVRELQERLDRMAEASCEALTLDAQRETRLWARLLRPLLYHVARHFPEWGRRFPRAGQKLHDLASAERP